MEFKEQQDFIIRQACERCGQALNQCSCPPSPPADQPSATTPGQSATANSYNTAGASQPAHTGAQYGQVAASHSAASPPADASTQSAQVAAALPNYVLGEPLSDSGRSIIYKARHAVTGQVFAVKVLKTKPIEDRTAQRKLQQEGKAITALTHPNIAAVYDYGLSSDNRPFVARDSVDGISLSQLIDKEGSLDKPRFLDIFLQIADALSHAHQNGVLHLSLKPENIILAKQTGSDADFVKVVDFGVSRMIPSQVGESEACANAAQYLSPEQCSGDALSAASDVYAFGCVMYEALCGHPPFEHADAAQVKQKQIRLAPPPVNKVARQPVSPELEALVTRCLAKDPRARPLSAKELEYELQRIADGTATINTQPAPSVLRAVDTPRPEPAWFSSARIGLAVTALAIIGGIAVFAMWPSQKTPVAVVAPPPAWKMSLDEAVKYERQGDLQMAENYLQQALNQAEANRAEDKDLAPLLSRLGSLYYASKRPRDAAPFLMRALPLYETMQGPAGADVDWIATDLAEIAQVTNNWPIAVEMYSKLQPIREKQNGKNSPRYAKVLAGLGGAYVHTHDYKSAEKYLRESLAIRAKLPQNSETNNIAASKTMLGLGYALDTQGKSKDAEKFYRDAVATAKKVQPQDKEVTVKALDYLSNFLLRTGRRAEGERLVREARVLRGLPAVSAESGGQSGGAGGGQSYGEATPGAIGGQRYDATAGSAVTRAPGALEKTKRFLGGTRKAIDGAERLLDRVKGR